ncbi:phage capsid protein [Hymenobacter sp. YC55]|uniref:phage capsid protein n=1 Tax=Hymenobacter sp. YC55 TaxID=3034019 RepID=UPI0023FA35A9|nr:phage capsid protein [Hymenobacter sp. YC55]MDF7813616.1 phage capsid protein [Hymenobacter sp. YC55]
MKTLSLLSKLTIGFFVALFVGVILAPALGVSPLAIGGGLFAAQVVRSCVRPVAMPGLAFDDVLTSIFTRDLQKILFPDNSFYKRTKRLNTATDAPGTAAASYQIPQELQMPEGIVDPATFPLEVEELEGGNEIVTLSLLATKPTRLGDKELLEVSYDKRASVLSLHSAVLDQMAAGVALNRMSQVASSAIVLTSGAAAAAALPGLTGNRKAVTKDDIIKGCEILDRTDMPGQRYGLVGATQYSELLKIEHFVDYNKTGNASALLTGAVGELMGVKWYKRSTGAMFTGAGAAKAAGSAAAADDNEGMLLWIEDAIGRVEGSVEVYINEKQAQYLGSLMNNAVRFGMKILRTDKKGVVAIRQSAAA